MMHVQTNYEPDITTGDTVAKRQAYFKQHTRNRKEARALALDMKRCPRGLVLFPGQSSFSRALRKYRARREAHLLRCGYSLIPSKERRLFVERFVTAYTPGFCWVKR